MNYWYVTFSIACLMACFESLAKEVLRKRIHNKINRLLECSQAMCCYFVIGTIPFGILWFVRSWMYDPYSIPERLKVQFMTILITFSIIIVALVIWVLATMFSLLSYLKRVKQKGQMG